MSAALPRTADVVVVGGGVHGASLAYHLARKKAGLAEDATVRVYPKLNPLERLRPAESSEDKAAALARIRLEAWGPLTTIAAELGLPSYGPLLLPGSWKIH